MQTLQHHKMPLHDCKRVQLSVQTFNYLVNIAEDIFAAFSDVH